MLGLISGFLFFPSIDFQKLKYEQYFENYTFKIGNEIIFWGVNESFNIIDIINQSNLAEDMTGTKKLGQPLLSLAYDNNYGTIDLYLMLSLHHHFPLNIQIYYHIFFQYLF